MIYVLSGGGGLSKCSIIVHIDSGSAVAAYSNSAATTLVKTGKEIGTSGDYLITGLNVGTYYVKATKGAESIVSHAVTFSANGVKDVVLSYALVIWENGDGLDAFRSIFSNVYGSPTTSLSENGNVIITLPTQGEDQTSIASINSYNASEFSMLEIRAKIAKNGAGAMGIKATRSSAAPLIAAYGWSFGPAETEFTTRRIDITSATDPCYIYFTSSAYDTVEIESIRFVR